MPSLFQGVCYPTAEAAKAQACSAASLTWGSGSSVYSLECASTSFDGPAMSLCKRVDGGTCMTIVQDYPVFSECEHSGGTDMAMDWMYLVLPVMAVLWGLKTLQRQFSEDAK